MPLYDYRCLQCGRKVEVLLLRRDDAVPPCPACGSREMQRLVSRFAYHRTEADRLAEIDTSKTPTEDFYRDDRNIGLRTKKRLQELGYDPGPDFEGIVERAKQKTAEALNS
ncbi:MAG: zinc ribbon domain-containing protein [Clostridia bacterium]|nr:zinc ribbon domain-containing protein [Clostridia bacterium]